MTTKMKLASGLGLFLALGCNNSVETNPTGSGGSSSSSASTTSTSSDAATTSTGASTGSGGACAAFADAAGTDAVTVRFRNNSMSPVYLPVSCKSVNFAIDPTTGPDGVTYHYDGSCLQTCEDLQTSPPFACGLCAPASLRIDVGATREVIWEGTGLKPDVQMPSSCWSAPQKNESCSQVVPAPAASYRVSATGFSSCGAGCTCDAQGICDGAAEGSQGNPNPVKFNYPADKTVEVVFDPCAFGCPDGN